jgi:hypothetical protein
VNAQSFVRAGLLPLLVASTLSAQKQLWEIPAPGPFWRQWYSVAKFRDFNHDGVGDFLVSSIYQPQTSFINDIEIRSGRDAQILWSLHVPLVVTMRDAGDCDGDGYPEVLLLLNYGGLKHIEVWSTRTSTMLWQAQAPPGLSGNNWGGVLLGDIDLNGDGLKDVIVATKHGSHSTLYSFDNAGNPLYTRDYNAIGRTAVSACNMGDTNGDGNEDFLLGCMDAIARGMMIVTSGVDGSDIQISPGFAPGDRLAEHATNLGDIDGDGIADYMGFPTSFSPTGLTVQFSGSTGNVIRFWFGFARSVVAGPNFDLDRDGVPDILIGNGELVAPNVGGRSRAISGRDGTVLWQVDNQPNILGSGISHAVYGWASTSVSLGTWPDKHYPSLSWIENDYFSSSTLQGRVRGFGSELLGQGPITGRPCSTTGDMPLIGARNTANGARVTVAKAPPGAIAMLNVATAGYHKQVASLLPLNLFGPDSCEVLALPELSAFQLTGAGPGIDRGYAAVDLPFQFSAAVSGTDLVAQWLILDPATLAFAATELHHLHGH